MKKIIYILLAITGLTISSCEKEINFSGKETESQVVVNSIIERDSLIKLDLTYSKWFLDSKQGVDTIKNAKVDLYVNNLFKETLSFVNDIPKEYYFNSYSYYVSTYHPQSGDNVHCVITIPGKDPINVTTQIPKPIEITRIDTTMTSNPDNSYSGFPLSYWDVDSMKYIDYGYVYSGICHVKLTFKDPENESNFYKLTIKSFSYNNYFWGYTGYDTDDPVFENSTKNRLIGSNNTQYNGIFTDEIFQGQTKTINFSFNLSISVIYDKYKDLLDDKLKLTTNTNYMIDLSQITKDTYYYIKTYDLAQSTGTDPFSEPAILYTNINGGLGIFGAMSSCTNPFVIK